MCGQHWFWLHLIYKVLRDQGGLIAALVALIAAWIAYRGAVHAANKQIAYLALESERGGARKSLSAITKFLSVCAKIRADIDSVQRILGKPPYTTSHPSVAQDLIRMVRLPALSIVWPDLSEFDHEIVGTYLRLDALTRQFQENKSGRGATEVMNDLANFRNFVDKLERELSDAAVSSNAILVKGQ